jgi:hypothetical protein
MTNSSARLARSRMLTTRGAPLLRLLLVLWRKSWSASPNALFCTRRRAKERAEVRKVWNNIQYEKPRVSYRKEGGGRRGAGGGKQEQ